MCKPKGNRVVIELNLRERGPAPAPQVAPRPSIGGVQIVLFAIFPLLLLVPFFVNLLAPIFDGLHKGPGPHDHD